MEEINLVAVGERIRHIRKFNLELTLKEFGALIDDMAQGGTVSNWERGQNLPSLARLKKIAEIGNTSTDYLLYGITNVKESTCKWIGDKGYWESGCGFKTMLYGNPKEFDFNYCNKCGQKIDIGR